MNAAKIDNGKTKVAKECSPLNPTEEERATFHASHEGMKGGGTSDRLAAYRAKI